MTQISAQKEATRLTTAVHDNTLHIENLSRHMDSLIKRLLEISPLSIGKEANLAVKDSPTPFTMTERLELNNNSILTMINTIESVLKDL